MSESPGIIAGSLGRDVVDVFRRQKFVSLLPVSCTQRQYQETVGQCSCLTSWLVFAARYRTTAVRIKFQDIRAGDRNGGEDDITATSGIDGAVSVLIASMPIVDYIKTTSYVVL